MRQIDLNCDMGESFGAYSIGNDPAIMQWISSANIACGFHAGDPGVIKRTVELAIKNNVAIGAHPSFPDLQGFGRREMHLPPAEIYEIVLYQVGALYAFVKAADGKLNHVKPHGALYNMAAIDRKTAEAIAKAIFDFDNNLLLYGLAGSELINTAKSIGLRSCNETFADRTYQPDGTLTPRSQTNGLIKDVNYAVMQVIRMVEENKVKATDGTIVPIEVDTICIHGDGPNAAEFAAAIHAALKEKNILIKSPSGS